MDIFYLKLFLSFVVGGLYIAFTMWVSEKFGSKIGGLAIGLPSTALVSLVFIAWTQDAYAAISAIPIMPAAFSINTLFVLCFIESYRWGERKAIASSLVLWLVLTMPLVLVHLDSLALSIVLSSVIFTFSIIMLSKYPPKKLHGFKITKKEFLLRAVFAGSVVAISVLLGKGLGPLWGGLFAAFPAAFSSSLILLAREHGIKFTASVAHSMPWGSVANVFFLLALFFSTAIVGFAQAIVIAYAVSVIAAIAAYEMFLR